MWNMRWELKMFGWKKIKKKIEMIKEEILEIDDKNIRKLLARFTFYSIIFFLLLFLNVGNWIQLLFVPLRKHTQRCTKEVVTLFIFYFFNKNILLCTWKQ